MQQFLCPQCGASVRFDSAGAVMVVCGSCRSTITRDAEAARLVGVMAELVEDGSLVQLGTRGRAGQRGFQVLGGLRLRYEAGSWNEWYIVFDEGTHGWLSDASGQYAITRRDEQADVSLLPSFDELRPGEPAKVGGALYTVSDVRRCRCIGGEGELPILVGDGWESRVVDARRGDAFVTLDYSDATPVVYSGTAGQIRFDKDTLRRKEEIEASTGRYRGKVLALDCPSCAGTVSIAVAMATQVVCPSCSTLLDCSGDRAEIIEANRRLARFNTTLSLGARGRLGAEYTVIGIMQCDVPTDRTEPAWTEYLLFNPDQGYLWLVETQEGWQRVSVCDDWPLLHDMGSARWGKRTWTRKYDYVSRVKQVFGAFNWRVRRGDSTRVTDFACGHETLTREQSDDEVTWSHAVRMGEVTIADAFGLPRTTRYTRTAPTRPQEDQTPDTGLIWIGIAGTVTLLWLSEVVDFGAILLGIGLIWAPLAMTGHLRGASSLLED